MGTHLQSPKALLVTILSLFTFKVYSQDLNLSVTGTKYKIQKDTILVEIHKKNINFSIVYTLTGTDLPNEVTIKPDPSYTIPPADIVSAAMLNKAVSLSQEGGYTGKLEISIPSSSSQEDDQYVTFVFNWIDKLKKNSTKEKKLTIKIHNKKPWPDIVPDPSNTPKLEIIQYTDFLGISSDRPNGAFQQQLLFKWPIVKYHLNISEKIKFQILRSVLIPNILLNRIDKAKDDSSMVMPISYPIAKHKDSAPDSSNTVVGSFDLIRYTNTMIETSVNVFALQLDNSRVYLNYDFGLLRNRIKGELSKDNLESRPVYSYVTGWHLYAKSLLNSKVELNIEVEAGFRRVRLQDNFYKQTDIFTNENIPADTIKFLIRPPDTKQTSRPIYYVSTKLSKDWGEKSTNYIFLRFKYQWQRGDFEYVPKNDPSKLLKDQFYNHFFQVNLGVSLGLEDLFKKK